MSGHMGPVDPITNAIANETPSVHSMVATGGDPIFLNHVGLFNDFNHQYQVTLEAELTDPQAKAEFAKMCPAATGQLCVVDPEYFLLSELPSRKRKSFKGTFFIGQWDTKIPGLENVDIRVRRIVRFRHYDPGDHYPPELQFQLFGSGTDVYLVNQVSEAPHFQEVLRVSGDPSVLTAAALARNPMVTIVGKSLHPAAPTAVKAAVLTTRRIFCFRRRPEC